MGKKGFHAPQGAARKCRVREIPRRAGWENPRAGSRKLLLNRLFKKVQMQGTRHSEE